MQKIKAQGGLLKIIKILTSYKISVTDGDKMVDSSEERLLWWNLVLLHTWSTFTCDSNELGLLLLVTHRYLALDTNIYLIIYLILKAINDIQI